MIDDRDVGRLADRHQIENFIGGIRSPITARIDRCTEQNLRRVIKRVDTDDFIFQLAVIALYEAQIRDDLTGRLIEIIELDLQLVRRERRVRIGALKTGKIVCKNIASGCRHEQIALDDDHLGEWCPDLPSPFSRFRARRSSGVAPATLNLS